MRALTKLCSDFHKYTSIFFSATLPQALRLAFLTLHVLWISYNRAKVKRNFISSIDKQSSKFIYKRRRRRRNYDCLMRLMIRPAESPPLLPPNCSICLSDFTQGEECREITMCKHIFHRNCIEKWLLHGNDIVGAAGTCPLCRNVVLPEEIMEEHRRVVQNQEAREEDHNRNEVELALLFLSTLPVRNCHRFT